MTSVVDLAGLSNAVYDDSNVKVGNWLRIGLPFTVRSSGFKSALFKHVQSNDFALAIAGTDPTDIDDLKSDAQIAFGNVPNQLRVARSAYHSVETVSGGLQKFYITGHSLGGGLASMLCKEHGEPCVTFNAPGMARSFASLQKIEPGVSAVEDSDRKVLHIRAAFDVVSKGTGRHMGKNAVQSVNTSPVGKKEVLAGAATAVWAGPAAGASVTAGMAAFKAHGIARLIPVLKQKPEYNKDLAWL